MIHTVVWLTLLGLALLVPNAVAFGLSFGGASSGGGAAAVSARSASAPRVRIGIKAPKLVRRGYLWKAVSPLLFGFSVVLGLGVGGTLGYGIMGLGFLNLLLGLWGWEGFVPGQTGRR